MRVIDDELRRRFGDLREADRESMPSFQGMLETARLPEPRRWRTTWTWAGGGRGTDRRHRSRLEMDDARRERACVDDQYMAVADRGPDADVAARAHPFKSPTFGSVLDGLAYRGH
jgi:hypothetical protein